MNCLTRIDCPLEGERRHCGVLLTLNKSKGCLPPSRSKMHARCPSSDSAHSQSHYQRAPVLDHSKMSVSKVPTLPVTGAGRITTSAVAKGGATYIWGVVSVVIYNEGKQNCLCKCGARIRAQYHADTVQHNACQQLHTPLCTCKDSKDWQRLCMA